MSIALNKAATPVPESSTKDDGIKKEDLKSAPEKLTEAKVPAVASASGEELSLENFTEADIFSDAIIAKPLGFDSSLDVSKDITNKNCYYRWVNRYGGELRRYQECISLGYVNATPKDVRIKDESMLRDGCIVVGDLILMKMDKAKAFGAMKANVLRAEAMVKPKSVLNKLQQDVGKATNAPADFLAEKVSFFVQKFHE
jgi:hypothetical protein